MLIAVFIFSIITLGLALVAITLILVINYKMARMETREKDYDSHLRSIASRVDQLGTTITGKTLEVESTWVTPKPERPKVIRRTEADEYEMEKPLGERRI